MNIKTIKDELIDEFSMFDDWMERYEYMIELGKSLPIIDSEFKTDDNIIKGCQSKVWLHADLVNDKVVYSADSDAIITKGIVAILIRVFSNQNPIRSRFMCLRLVPKVLVNRNMKKRLNLEMTKNA